MNTSTPDRSPGRASLAAPGPPAPEPLVEAAVASLDARTFERFRSLIYDTCGIVLQDNKQALVAARIGRRMRALALGSAKEYLQVVLADGSGQELIYLVDAISTNVTSFMREPDHFQLLAQLAREWSTAGARRLRFWSAACSSGEEPYSMAMTLHAALGDSLDVSILATDISTRVLQQCAAGRYGRRKLDSLPPEWRQAYVQGHGQDACEVAPALRRWVVPRRLNLARPPFPMHGPLDAVFCRNVMIYFDKDVRQRLLAEIARLLKPGGYLFVGHAESLAGLETELRPLRPSIYRKG